MWSGSACMQRSIPQAEQTAPNCVRRASIIRALTCSVDRSLQIGAGDRCPDRAIRVFAHGQKGCARPCRWRNAVYPGQPG